MAQITFPSGIPTLSAPLSLEIKARVRSVQFGDGYSARSPDGINTLLFTEQLLTWNNISLGVKDSLKLLFKNCKGVHYFILTLPGESVPSKLRPISFSESKGKTDYSVSMLVDEIP
jgi:phage-related protein